MSSEAARCPHCGARQASTEGGAAPSIGASPPRQRIEKTAPTAVKRAPLTDVSPDEARALLAVKTVSAGGVSAGHEPNIIQWLFLPHPRSRGVAWLGEVVFTLLALPSLLLGSLGLIVMLRRVQSARRDGSAAAGKVLSIFGVTLFGVVASGGSLVGSIAAGAVPTIALVAREAIRSHSDKRGSPDLLA